MIDKKVLQRIKLVVFDLDGTLINDNNEIGIETKALIDELKNHDVQFSIATGRLFSGVSGYADDLKIDLPLITLDGSLIKKNLNNQTIFEAYVPVRYVKRAIQLADKYLLKAALCHDKAIYYTEENSIFPLIMEKFGTKYQMVNSYNPYLENTLEVVLVGEYKANVKFIENKMTFPYTFGVKTSFYKSQNQGGIYYLEIRKMGCTKGDGLKKLLRHSKIKMKETAVIGDWYNDKSLFENDSLKVAIGNAVPELKRMADLVLKKTNNEEGVTDFLRMLLNAKK